MKIARPSRTRMDIGLVPMINVVFLLLIFFLMTARLGAPPMEIEAAVAPDALARVPADTLYLAREGAVFFNAMSGDAAVWPALAAWASGCEGCALDLLADRNADAAGVVAILAELARIGIEDVSIVTQAP